MKQCSRCPLTALWQVNFTVKLRVRPDVTGKICSPYLVCGMCADDVRLADYSDDIEQIAAGMIEFEPEILLRLDDISDGYWNDPSRTTPQRVPV